MVKMHENLQASLAEYRKLWMQIETLGGLEYEGPLLGQLFGLEEEILSTLDRPGTRSNRELVQHTPHIDNPEEAAIWLKIELGRKRSKTELEQQHPVERLRASVEEERDSFEALPELGITTHAYPIHLYELALEGTLDVEQALQAMQAAEPHLELLGRLRFAYAEAAELGVAALDSYLQNGMPEQGAGRTDPGLSPIHMDLVLATLEYTAGDNFVCPVCDEQRWEVADSLSDWEGRVVAALSCEGCGLALAFDAGTIGLLDDQGELLTQEGASERLADYVYEDEDEPDASDE